MWRNPDSTTDSTTLPLREPYVLLFLAFVTLGVYYPAVLSGFCTMDDIIGVTSMLNSSAKALPRLLGFGVAGFYRRPLSNLVRYGLYLMSGEQPLLFHLFNVLLHLGCGLVVYFLVKGRLKAGIPASWPALMAALLFLLHPLNVEAVAWMSGHCTVMASFFALLAFYYHQRVQAPRTDWRLWLAAGFYLLSLLSYELAAAIPLAFIGWDLLEQRDLGWREAARQSYRRWLSYGVVLSLYLLYWGLSQWSSREISQITGGVSPSIFDANFLLKLVPNPVIGLGFYFKKTIIPWPLNFHIGGVDKVPYFLLGVGCLLLLGIGLRRRSWWAAWGWAFVCSLLPILSLTVYSHSWTSLAERYAYLGSSFFAISVGLLVAKLPPCRRRAVGYAFMVLPLAVFFVAGYSTANRVLVWQDDESLFADTLGKSPHDGWVAYSYACVMHRMKKDEEAERYMKRAYDLGFVAESALMLGGLEENRGNYKDAERYYLKAAWPSANVRRMTRNCKPEVYEALGNLHWRWAKRDPGRAAHHHERVVHFFGRAYEFSNKDPWILYNFGKFYLDQGKIPEAQQCFRTVHEKVPDTYYGKAAGKLMLVESQSHKERPNF